MTKFICTDIIVLVVVVVVVVLLGRQAKTPFPDNVRKEGQPGKTLNIVVAVGVCWVRLTVARARQDRCVGNLDK